MTALCFDCDGVFTTKAPRREVYNAAFEAIRRALASTPSPAQPDARDAASDQPDRVILTMRLQAARAEVARLTKELEEAWAKLRGSVK